MRLAEMALQELKLTPDPADPETFWLEVGNRVGDRAPEGLKRLAEQDQRLAVGAQLLLAAGAGYGASGPVVRTTRPSSMFSDPGMVITYRVPVRKVEHGG